MPVFTSEKGFTDKMEKFCQEYLIDMNSSAAAKRAGYSESTASEQGCRLLTKVKIKRRIKELAEQNATAAEITPELVLTTIKATMERCSQDIKPVMTKGKQSLEIGEDGAEHPVFKFDSQGVFRGAELLGRYLTLFTDKTELSGVNGQPIEIISADMEQGKAARIYAEMMRR